MFSYLKKALRLSIIFILLHSQAGWSGELRLESGNRQNTLIELYTSQGCSSCPPAERWLGELQHDPRLWQKLIPVAFHVDYWDYLGWRDQFAKPAYSERQRRYQRENRLKVVYTPGFVVNGQEWRRWFGLKKLPASDRKAGNLILDWDGKAIHARYEAAIPDGKAPVLNVAILGVGIVADIKRGENAGQKLPQDFVVLEHRQLRSSNGRWVMELPRVSTPDGARVAIAAWVSRNDSQAPLQAVGGWLPD